MDVSISGATRIQSLVVSTYIFICIVLFVSYFAHGHIFGNVGIRWIRVVFPARDFSAKLFDHHVDDLVGVVVVGVELALDPVHVLLQDGSALADVVAAIS